MTITSTRQAIKIAATFAVAVFVVISSLLVSSPKAEAAEKWPTHARVITNERNFEQHKDRVFRITVRGQDGHGRYVKGRASLYVNGKHKDTDRLEWGWASYKLGRHTLPNGTSKVTVVIKPDDSRQREVRFVRVWVTDKKKPRPVSAGKKIVAAAKSQVGDNYRYGAAGPTSWDCSGLTSYAVKKGTGKNIPHSSAAQKGYGKTVSLSNAKPGDLIISTGHVSVYAGNGTVVEAANPQSGVRVAKLWQKNVTVKRNW